MKTALVFESSRSEYEVYDVVNYRRPMTVGELRDLLDDYDDDDVVIVSHDDGWTYGTISYLRSEDVEEEQ